MQVPPFSLSKQLANLAPELDIAISRVLRSGHFIGGEEVEAFEESFARTLGVSNAVSCNSGTDALILALRALDIGVGDEVITCSFSFFATAEAISAVGAKPVFVDVSDDDYLLDLSELEKAINSSTKAIMPVHLFGRPVNMEKLLTIARKYKLKVIEDCAQAAGAKWNGCSVGSWGNIGCFSFFPTKNLGAAGDSGAVVTNDASLAMRMRHLSMHGMPSRYLHTELGYNSRMDAIQAAVLNVKLPKLMGWIDQRQAVAKYYQEMLGDCPSLILPAELDEENATHCWNQFVIRIKSFSDQIENFARNQKPFKDKYFSFPNNENPRDRFKLDLESEGVTTIIYYPIPIHLQPAYADLGYKVGSLPKTEKLCCEVLSLPIFPEITKEQQDYVISRVKTILTE